MCKKYRRKKNIKGELINVRELQVESVIRLGRRVVGGKDAAQAAEAKPQHMLVKLSRAETKFEIAT